MLRNYVVSLLFFGAISFFHTCSAQIQNNAEEAFKVSTETNKPVLLVFAGSDWCANCIRFEKRILSTGDFLSFAEKSIIVLKADFPQRTPLSAALQEQNASLAEKYNPDGVFPFLLLLTPGKSVLSSIIYRDQSPAQFIDEIQTYIAK
ncbi:MAG TPA: thioredoxin family protein [Chryseolinea sp.]|nr:thioredoxin family protein [Chryseolinea sp.]